MIKNSAYETTVVPAARPREINAFLLKNGLLIKKNPAISPDLTLDFDALVSELELDLSDILIAIEGVASGRNCT